MIPHQGITTLIVTGLLCFAQPAVADARSEAVARLNALSDEQVYTAISDWLRARADGCKIKVNRNEFSDDLPEGLSERFFTMAQVPPVLWEDLVKDIDAWDGRKRPDARAMLAREFTREHITPEVTILTIRDCLPLNS